MANIKVCVLGVAWVGMVLSTIGCVELVGSLLGASEGLKELERQQIMYCGPDGEAMFEKDKKDGKYLFPPDHLKRDKLCGKNGIRFENLAGRNFEPTALTEAIIFKSINHFKGMDDQVNVFGTPERPYIVIGVMTFPKKWYYNSTIDEYMIETMSEVGAHAVLEYETFQDSAMMRKSDITGEMFNVFRMKMKATLIRYTD